MNSKIHDEKAEERPDSSRSPGAETSQDVETIRQSMQEIDQGKCKEARVYFDELQRKLLAMKMAQETR